MSRYCPYLGTVTQAYCGLLYVNDIIDISLNMAQLKTTLSVTEEYISNLIRPHRCLLCVVSMCINTPLSIPSVLYPLVCPAQTVHRLKSPPSVPSLCCWFCLSASHSLSMFQWQIFKEQLHTRVVLVAVEIWTDKDHIPISVRPLEMLQDFSKYRQQSIKHHADAVHLIS